MNQQLSNRNRAIFVTAIVIAIFAVACYFLDSYSVTINYSSTSSRDSSSTFAGPGQWTIEDGTFKTTFLGKDTSCAVPDGAGKPEVNISDFNGLAATCSFGNGMTTPLFIEGSDR